MTGVPSGAGRPEHEVTVAREPGLPVGDFLGLAQRVWPGDHAEALVDRALRRTLNVTARRDGVLVGCVRVLTDGYFLGIVTEILVDPDHQRQGIGRRLMEVAWEASPTGWYFGAQPGREGFFERCGFERALTGFARRKPRPAADPGPGEG
ncbi:MAG: GNAT family N-acetyltransferase [Alphaproteobacteria bacterium]|nr:GNAT family N-acetyltransferase [Alphaproteobacteria bacterium]